ncbi:Kinetochore protein Spc24 [Coniosporium tulheliwenetii]|uniref:Kinetochore protein Spc24 n=1 Tax=Coniosporium tulheliwenetii TaxID=3383036 RepID=A0ACC2YPK3_9PEZI|nr:Kinetochore protein Spc24 [Cladosporium sp. JES 115]
MARSHGFRHKRNAGDSTGANVTPLGAAPERPAKRIKLLDDSASEASDAESPDQTDENSESDGGVSLKINEEYARRFEHNKKREERHRLEEKHGKSSVAKGDEDGASGSDDSSSEDESEDDEGLLATEDLDAEISATLQAIRSKDPRVYDKSTTFYKEEDNDTTEPVNGEKKEKPMYLRDYHRKNLLEGNIDAEDENDGPPQTYAQEQEALRDSLVKQMHAAAEPNGEASVSDDDDGFLRKKESVKDTSAPTAAKKVRPIVTETDVAAAEKDPDTFLSNFMQARAWVPDALSRFQPLESDDEEEERRAEEFEEAYNLRFENPEGANEKLMTHSRDAAAKYSVRRDELSGRKKVREMQRAKREAEKAEREEEKARLRKLKIEEMEERVQRIKEAAGLRVEDWAKVLDEDWDDDRWDEEMKRRFGESYYAEGDEAGASGASSDEEDTANGKKKRKVKKPKWNDDIDIKDLVPDFSDEEAAKPAFTLTDDEADGGAPKNGQNVSDVDMEDTDEPSTTRKPKTKKDRLAAKADAKRAARKERRIIETISSKNGAAFRYRETSPTTFGLTPLDILLADDSQLNQYAGLKKMAAFRDQEKKLKDKKKLGKKARLRQWRKETFGNESEPRPEAWKAKLGTATESDGLRDPATGSTEQAEVDVREGKKRRRRPKKTAGGDVGAKL